MEIRLRPLPRVARPWPRPIGLMAVFALALGAAHGAEKKPDAAALKFFETKIRPLLAENCYECHGAKKQKSDLRLDNIPFILQGGEGGPAVVPGDVENSRLVLAISYEDADLQMPPDGKLEDAQIADLKKWVELGAPWPEKEAKAVRLKKAGEFSEEDRGWWAFQPVKRPVPPEIRNPQSAIRNPIDHFVIAKLESENLQQAPMANRYELVRRVYFDLHGLPPTPEEVKSFVEDKRPDAYDRLVNALLDHPRYGERWAQHWLDVARYAESDGYRQDAYRPDAWPYRDYVVRSLNNDKPYDQFVREQLAGDEMAPGDPEVMVATAYLRNGIYEYNQRDAETQRTTILTELTDTSGELFLGLSFGCARCHDHKFDPILQKDYFRLLAFFAPVIWRDDLKLATAVEQRAHEAKMQAWLDLTKEARAPLDALIEPKKTSLRKSVIEKFPEEVQALAIKPDAEKLPYDKIVNYLVERQVVEEHNKLTPAGQKGEFKAKLEAALEPLKPFEESRPAPLPVAFVATDAAREAPPTRMAGRRETIEDVKPGFLTILAPGDAKITPPAKLESTGRRTALANWITRPDNPLSTRVIANRVWQYHFGRGLVTTSSDFGRLGEKPSHPELLDWLASGFVANGWSLKWLHRQIMLSATYQQTARFSDSAKKSPSNPQSAIRNPQLVDPENRLLWRMNPVRLDAEQARDAVLALSGELKPNMGGPGEEPAQPRRTLYTRKKRNSQDEFLHSLDAPPGFASVAKRDSTTTALQSLLMINGDWTLARAHAMAARLMKVPEATTDSLVDRAFQLAFSRTATKSELAAATTFVKRQQAVIERDSPQAPVLASPLVDAKTLFGTHPLGGVKTVAFKPGTQFEKMRVQAGGLESEEFTVEAVIYLDSLYPDASVRTIASRWNNDKASKGWALGVTSEKSAHKPGNLIMQLCGDDFQGSVIYEVVPSGIHLTTRTPYYVAAVLSHTLAPDQKFGGTITYFVRNLADAGAELQSVTVQHPVVGGYVNPERTLMLGGRERDTRSLWDGAISRVVVTSGLLAKEQLLIGTVQNAPRCLFDAQAETLASTSEPKFTWEKSAAKPGPGAIASPRLEALADFCHVLINSNEFLYLQ